jgi:hypothetical protein
MSRFVQSLGLLLSLGLVTFVASPALAQERGFATGIGAVTFGTVTGANIAGRAGVSLSNHVMVFGEVGHMTNVLPKSEESTINDNAATVGDSMGGAALVGGGMPAAYGSGGVRVNGTMHNHVTPFAEASLGFAHLTNTLNASVNGSDVTSLVVTTPLTTSLPETDPLLGLGAGVSIRTGAHAALEVGYRYSRIFASTQGINTGNVYGAVRVGF